MIIVINGFPRSGKDLFVSKCKEALADGNDVLNVSTVDFVKDVAKYCGWDGTKSLQNRAFLSDLKDLLTVWDDVPYKKVCIELDKFFMSHPNGIAFVHSREPEDIAKYVERLGARTLIIHRAAVENEDHSNHADTNVLNYHYDYEVSNDGTFDDLYNEAKKFLKGLGYETK